MYLQTLTTRALLLSALAVIPFASVSTASAATNPASAAVASVDAAACEAFVGELELKAEQVTTDEQAEQFFTELVAFLTENPQYVPCIEAYVEAELGEIELPAEEEEEVTPAPALPKPTTPVMTNAAPVDNVVEVKPIPVYAVPTDADQTPVVDRGEAPRQTEHQAQPAAGKGSTASAPVTQVNAPAELPQTGAGAATLALLASASGAVVYSIRRARR